MQLRRRPGRLRVELHLDHWDHQGRHHQERHGTVHPHFNFLRAQCTYGCHQRKRHGAGGLSRTAFDRRCAKHSSPFVCEQNDSLAHCLEFMRPGITKLYTTMKQLKVLTALQLINPHVGKAGQPNSFSEKYRQIFQNEIQIQVKENSRHQYFYRTWMRKHNSALSFLLRARAQSSGRTVDQDLRFIFGFIQSIFVDWHAFKSRSVKGQLSALQQLFYAGDIDALYRFIANPPQN